MKAVLTLGYDQPADMTIRKTLGLCTFIFKSGKYFFCSTPNGKSVL